MNASLDENYTVYKIGLFSNCKPTALSVLDIFGSQYGGVLSGFTWKYFRLFWGGQVVWVQQSPNFFIYIGNQICVFEVFIWTPFQIWMDRHQLQEVSFDSDILRSGVTSNTWLSLWSDTSGQGVSMEVCVFLFNMNHILISEYLFFTEANLAANKLFREVRLTLQFGRNHPKTIIVFFYLQITKNQPHKLRKIKMTWEFGSQKICDIKWHFW